MSELDKLQQIAQKFGGDIVESSCYFDSVTAPEINGTKVNDFYEAPFSSNRLGIAWQAKTVVYYDTVCWTEVIHEMGHCFATDLNPNQSSEWDFFGWEYCLAEYLALDMLVWCQSNASYNIDFPELSLYCSYFGSFSVIEQMKIIQERISYGKKIGIIDSLDRPLTVL